MTDYSFFFIGLTAFVCVLGSGFAWLRWRDPFHPALFLGPMLAFMYVVMPAYLLVVSPVELRAYLTPDELDEVALLNLLGAAALLGGALAGGWRRDPAPPVAERRLSASKARAAALVLGGLGALSFVVGIVNVGGFSAAYGRSYGGGWSESGYIRDGLFLTIPALVWLLLTASAPPRRRWWQWALVGGSLALPFLIHGLLGARRGPTFMGVMALGLGYYLARRRRPAMVTLAAGLGGLGLLMLVLVANRDTIHLGSSAPLSRPASSALELGAGNEYVYGGAVVLDAQRRDEFMWGRRYLVVMFIRPIPRFLWPTKYEDASELLGLADVRVNLGLGTTELRSTMGWAGAKGAAPGIVADMFLEWWWLGLAALWGLGWLHGRCWRLALNGGPVWSVQYAVLVTLSAYLVTQTLEAMLFRALIMSAGLWVVWLHARERTAAPAPAPRPRLAWTPR